MLLKLLTHEIKNAYASRIFRKNQSPARPLARNRPQKEHEKENDKLATTGGNSLGARRRVPQRGIDTRKAKRGGSARRIRPRSRKRNGKRRLGKSQQREADRRKKDAQVPITCTRLISLKQV